MQQLPVIRENLQKSVDLAVTRLLALEQQLRNYDQQFKSTAQLSAPTVETQSSRDIYDRIINQVVVDHMAESDEDEQI